MCKKILVIGFVWPEPNSSAAGSHMMSLLRFFKGQQWKIEFASPAQPTEHMVNLSEHGITSQSIQLNCSSFDDYIQTLQPDIVMFDRFMMEEQFGWRVDKYAPHALKILDTEDLQCLRNARHEAHRAKRELSQADLHSDLAKREVAAILRCDISLIISSHEMDLLTNTYKVDPALLHHLPFMVNLEKLPNHVPCFEKRQHFMTIGNFRHAPNWDAVLYLQEIWPLIRKQLPHAQLHIYGSYPPPKATALSNPKTGFYIKGWTEDALEVMKNARVCLAPLRFGAGIKGKLLEAMITKTPSVTTDIGAEGMHLNLPWPGHIANDAQSFADAAIELYRNQQTYAQAQYAAEKVLNTVYNKPILEQRLLQRLVNIINNLHSHRQDNFMGQMLKHHTMRSTQYMAQWIAAKNVNKSH
ncbi:hypothetical protein PSECIP111951_00123 [Pseudoalteromonas holothuriae]|uniref:Glycosyltransferase n=1 Tax=Pseudoalteromonas holothuriae TaxID=2963714 RepID=A0A9W4QTK0_9GAMM|nr:MULTISPECIES: glycosyltransferase family 4 protein [unclassified Pseudoalteromonas]CAH9050112.1 hypothetical protein PSECIP111951_00123 [Pseudoalteromonas sp. CIP111951]CAH9052568.1 hypothetical protein PSECIP111854_00996 [Pseudoalteromonas sp. CIP111854]